MRTFPIILLSLGALSLVACYGDQPADHSIYGSYSLIQIEDRFVPTMIEGGVSVNGGTLNMNGDGTFRIEFDMSGGTPAPDALPSLLQGWYHIAFNNQNEIGFVLHELELDQDCIDETMEIFGSDVQGADDMQVIEDMCSDGGTLNAVLSNGLMTVGEDYRYDIPALFSKR